jgi:hypothetical protein
VKLNVPNVSALLLIQGRFAIPVHSSPQPQPVQLLLPQGSSCLLFVHYAVQVHKEASQHLTAFFTPLPWELNMVQRKIICTDNAIKNQNDASLQESML